MVFRKLLLPSIYIFEVGESLGMLQGMDRAVHCITTVEKIKSSLGPHTINFPNFSPFNIFQYVCVSLSIISYRYNFYLSPLQPSFRTLFSFPST